MTLPKRACTKIRGKSRVALNFAQPINQPLRLDELVIGTKVSTQGV